MSIGGRREDSRIIQAESNVRRGWNACGWFIVKMAPPAMFLTVVTYAVIALTSGYKIENTQPQFTFPAANSFSTPSSPTVVKLRTGNRRSFSEQHIAGYPKVPPANAYESGGRDEDLLPPLPDNGQSFGVHSFRRSIENAKVDPKTGYPLIAEPSWKDAGGNEESLQLPLEISGKSEEEVDPKTGYPLVAKVEWFDAGGDGDILDLPLEEVANQEEAVDSKTGYPLKAQPGWKDAGGDGDILEPPLEDNEKVDPKTGYPLVAKPSWKDAGGNEEILQPPLEDDAAAPSQEAVDPKTGYPLVAQPKWKDAGGDGGILQVPLKDTDEKSEKVDPKTGYPLVAQPGWKDAGGNEEILQLPVADFTESLDSSLQGRSGLPVADELPTELQPPPLHATFALFNTDPTPSSTLSPRTIFQSSGKTAGSIPQIQTRKAASNPSFIGVTAARAIESSYTYTGPENVVVTVTRFTSPEDQQKQVQQQTPDFVQNGQFRNTISQSFAPTTFQSNVHQFAASSQRPNAFGQTFRPGQYQVYFFHPEFEPRHF